MHCIILSGMNAKDTSLCLQQNGFKNAQIMPNQIKRFVKLQNKERITVWVVLNTQAAHQLLPFIHYRIQNIIFLYDFRQPITLVRALGWWKLMHDGDYKMVLCSMPAVSPTEFYDKMIEHISYKFLLYDGSVVPHYTCKLKHIFKYFLNAY